ncbi:MAG: hypothetical protein Q8M54_00450 [Desulfobaccales bacterium]|nr:hypothetical protein [Desulfobaccales bacterium]
MKFYKICDSAGPHKDLPTVQWDKKSEKPLFEFTRTGVRGVMSFTTNNSELISLLRAAGYHEVMPQGLGNIGAMAMAGAVADDASLPQPQLTEQTRNLLRRFSK